MNDAIVIKTEGLSKKFCISQKKTMLYGGLDIVRSMIGMPQRRDTLRDHEIWALQDINFKVMRGDSLGIIGVNGAGKSTLLRVLSGIYPPDRGTVTVRGTIGALIAAGAGFHPDMTGRENIFLNGAIVGLKKEEISEKLDEIIEFAEIGEFIDSPVRFYSSGMYVRLGFAIAVNIRPNILIMDEILSVGDLTFQNKCFRKLKDLRDSVDAVLFVSHNLNHIKTICNKLIVIDAGRIAFHGDVDGGLLYYQNVTLERKKKYIDTAVRFSETIGDISFDTREVELDEIELTNQGGENTGEISSGENLAITTRFTTHRKIDHPLFSVGIVDERNADVILQMNHDNGVIFDSVQPGSYVSKVTFYRLPLVAGVYRVNVAIRDGKTGELLTKHIRTKSVIVRGDRLSRGVVDCESTWQLGRPDDEFVTI